MWLCKRNDKYHVWVLDSVRPWMGMVLGFGGCCGQAEVYMDVDLNGEELHVDVDLDGQGGYGVVDLDGEDVYVDMDLDGEGEDWVVDLDVEDVYVDMDMDGEGEDLVGDLDGEDFERIQWMNLYISSFVFYMMLHFQISFQASFRDGLCCLSNKTSRTIHLLKAEIKPAIQNI